MILHLDVLFHCLWLLHIKRRACYLSSCLGLGNFMSQTFLRVRNLLVPQKIDTNQFEDPTDEVVNILLNSLWSGDVTCPHNSWVNISSGNALGLERHQAITWTGTDFFVNCNLANKLKWKFNRIAIIFIEKGHLKLLFAKCWSFSSGLAVLCPCDALTHCSLVMPYDTSSLWHSPESNFSRSVDELNP